MEDIYGHVKRQTHSFAGDPSGRLRRQGIYEQGSVLYTVDDHTLVNDNYLQIFVELSKLVPERGSEDFGNLFLRAMRDIGKSKTRQKEYIDERLDTLFDASSYNHLSDEEQKQYEESMTTVEDLMSYARVQREEGRDWVIRLLPCLIFPFVNLRRR